MRWTCLLLLLLALPAFGSGCRNTAGERVSFGEWWHSRQDAGQKAESAPERDDDLATPALDDHAERTSPGPQGEGDEAAAEVATADQTGTSASGDPGRDAVSAPSPDAVHSDALVVNNETISVGDILEPILPTIEKLSNELPPQAYYQRVRVLVRDHIIEEVAQRLIWRRAEAELDEGLEPQISKAVDKMEKDRINREFNGSETRYTKYLAKRDKTRAQVRERLRRSLVIDSYLREHLLPLVPSPRKAELLQFYNAQRDNFSRPAKREMFLIDVPIAAFVDRRKPLTETGVGEATAQARATAQDAAEALKAGESFEEVARKHSHGVNKTKGGAWGFINGPLRSRWTEPSKRLFEMGPSEVSEIIEAADSFFIVKVGRIETGEELSFEDAQPRIAQILRQQRSATLRGEFLRKELEQSTLGSLDAFVTEVLKSVPPPRGM